MTFGERLKKSRKDKGYEAQYVAKKLNVAKSTYSGYENDKTKPSFDILHSMTELLDVSTDYLLGNMNKKTNDNNHTKKDKEKLEDFLDNARGHFMDAKEDDMDKIMKSLQDIFWETKEMNRKKYNPNKNK